MRGGRARGQRQRGQAGLCSQMNQLSVARSAAADNTGTGCPNIARVGNDASYKTRVRARPPRKAKRMAKKGGA